MPDTTCLDDLPDDLITAVATEAQFDADLVGSFLDALGLIPKPDKLFPFSAAFLQDLAAALHLLEWERIGFNPTELGGMPSGDSALLGVLRSVLTTGTNTEEPRKPGSLALRVLSAFVDHFSWHGRSELDVDVMLAEADEEAVLDEMADFLWTHRRR